MEIQGASGGRLKTAFAFGLATAVLVLIYWLIPVLLLLFIALLVGILLDSIASLGMRFLKLPRSFAVVLASVLVVAGLAGGLALIIVPLAKQVTGFVQSVPSKLATFDRWVERDRREFPWIERFFPRQQAPAAGQKEIKAPELAKKAFVTVSKSLDWGATALGVFFLGMFLAFNPDRWVRGIAELWPGPIEERVALFRRMGEGLRSYLFMLGLYILIMGAAWAAGLWLIGIEYPLLFGAIGGLVEIVPYIGPMLGLIPPLLFAFSGGTTKVLFVLLLYVILHILEGYVLVPFLMNRREHLPPPLVVLSILVCGKLFGTLGVVLAVPIATAAYVLVNETVYAARKTHPATLVPH